MQLFRYGNSNSKSKRHLCWLVFGSSTYYPYVFVALIIAALMSSLICDGALYRGRLHVELFGDHRRWPGQRILSYRAAGFGAAWILVKQ